MVFCKKQNTNGYKQFIPVKVFTKAYKISEKNHLNAKYLIEHTFKQEKTSDSES